MRRWARPDPNSFASAIRLGRMLHVIEEPAREYIFEHMQKIESEVRLQQAVDRQLEADLLADIYRDHKDGTANSLLFQRLPPEIRHQIFAHILSTDQSIHVFPPKGNESHGFRLSLCDESSYDFELGICRCDDSRAGRNVRSEFFNNALFLVSQTVRREALDSFFITNKFTFTCLYELVRFTGMFTQSSSKIQHLRLFERVDDYAASEYRLESIQNARLRLKGLKHFELYMFLASWSAYEELYEDGLVDQLIHFALGPPLSGVRQNKRRILDVDENSETEVVEFKKISLRNDKHRVLQCTTDSGYASVKSSPSTGSSRPIEISSIFNPVAGQFALPPSDGSPTISTVPVDGRPLFRIPALKSFTPHVRLRSQYLTLRLNRQSDPKQLYYDDLYKRLSGHLTDVFMDAGRRYLSVEDVPKLGDKPKIKVREEERPLSGAERRGILFMKD